MWNNYRAARIHPNEVLIHCCLLAIAHTYAEVLELDFEDTKTQSRVMIEELISDILCQRIVLSRGGRLIGESRRD